MFGAVLVPLDGSKLAEEALQPARTLAVAARAGLRLLRIIPFAAEPAEQREAQAYLAGLAERLDVPRSLSVHRGVPADEIVRQAAVLPNAIVAMSTHGRTGLGRALFGSVAADVVRRSGVPVLLVRSGIAAPSLEGIASILLPLDGSVLSESAVTPARRLAQVLAADVHLVAVVDTGGVYRGLGAGPVSSAAPTLRSMADAAARDVAEASGYLAGVAREFAKDGVRAETHVLDGAPADLLLAFERERGTGLTVMATHGRSGLEGLAVGSVADRLLRAGRAPVVLIRPPEPNSR